MYRQLLAFLKLQEDKRLDAHSDFRALRENPLPRCPSIGISCRSPSWFCRSPFCRIETGLPEEDRPVRCLGSRGGLIQFRRQYLQIYLVLPPSSGSTSFSRTVRHRSRLTALERPPARQACLRPIMLVSSQSSTLRTIGLMFRKERSDTAGLSSASPQ